MQVKATAHSSMQVAQGREVGGGHVAIQGAAALSSSLVSPWQNGGTALPLFPKKTESQIVGCSQFGNVSHRLTQKRWQPRADCTSPAQVLPASASRLLIGEYPYFAMYNAHCLAQIFKEKVRMHIIHG